MKNSLGLYAAIYTLSFFISILVLLLKGMKKMNSGQINADCKLCFYELITGSPGSKMEQNKNEYLKKWSYI